MATKKHLTDMKPTKNTGFSTLDSLKKANVHRVPTGYFDTLPQMIQTRVTETKSSPAYWAISLRYLAPAMMVVLVAGYFFFNTEKMPLATPENLLAQVSQEDIMAYLVNSELSTEELMESAAMDDIDLDQVLLDDIDLDTEATDLYLEDWDIDVDVDEVN